MKGIFSIDDPHLMLTTDFEQCRKSLLALGVEYKQVTDGYITFPAKLFGSDVDFMVGIHGDNGVPKRVLFIEVFRPEGYYSSSHDLWSSFEETSEILRKRYGPPDREGRSGISVLDADRLPYEKWRTEDYIVEHCIMDRLALYESLHIKFYAY